MLHSILVNGVVFKDNKVLISRRSFEEKHMPGWWTIPGGKVEQGSEDMFQLLEKSLAREILEETGVKVEEDMQMITNNSYIRPHDNQHVVAIVFKCKYKSGEAKPLDDTIDCKWASIEEIKDMEFPPNVKEYILKAFEDKFN